MNYLLNHILLLSAITYTVGIFLTLIFLKYFGEKIGLQFKTVEKDNLYQEIWTNKIGAVTSLSLIWPIYIPMLILVTCCKLVFYILYVLISPLYMLIRKLTTKLIKEDKEIEPY